MSFDEWKQCVDIAIGNILGGLTSEDIDDWAYATAYEAGMTPTIAARKAIAYSKKNCGL